jgi:hypothetical protein
MLPSARSYQHAVIRISPQPSITRQQVRRPVSGSEPWFAWRRRRGGGGGGGVAAAVAAAVSGSES